MTACGHIPLTTFSSRSILGLMPTRLARFLACALAVFLLAQPIPALAFSSSGGDCASSCCHDSMSCCRKSHRHTSGPAFSSRECCQQCHVSVRQNQPVAETTAF